MNPSTKFQLKKYISSYDFKAVNLDKQNHLEILPNIFSGLFNTTDKRQPRFLSSKWLLHTT